MHACQSINELMDYLDSSPASVTNGMPMIKILAVTSVFDTTVPHDQIFALLGLVWAQDRDNITIDYTLPYPEILIQFSQHIIRSGFLRDLLHVLSWSKLKWLPSWVLDPSHKSDRDLLDKSNFYSLTSDAYQAGGNNGPYVDFDPAGRRLSVRSIILGRINSLTEPYPSDLDIDGEQWNHVGRWCLEAERVSRTNAISADAKKAKEVCSREDFWSTLTAGGQLNVAGFETVLRDLQNHIEAFEAWLDMNAVSDFTAPIAEFSFNERVEGLHNYMTQLCLGRRFAVSNTGQPCLVPETTELGDRIVVFMGLPIPFILRPSTPDLSGEELRHQHYKLVGSAYVHGVMDGELINDHTYDDTEDIWLE